MICIETKNLTKKYKDVIAVNNLNLKKCLNMTFRFYVIFITFASH